MPLIMSNIKNDIIDLSIDAVHCIINHLDFKLHVKINSENEQVFWLEDLQNANLGDIEQDEFHTLAAIIDRLDTYYDDAFYNDIKIREDEGEIVPDDDFSKMVIKFIENDSIAEILGGITPEKYCQYVKSGKTNAGSETIIKIFESIEPEDISDYCEKNSDSKKTKTKTVIFKVWCQAYYNGSYEVPEHMDKKEAMEYVEEHLDEIPIDELNYLPNSDELDEEDFEFEED